MENVAYFSGGSYWFLDDMFVKLSGVIDVVCGTHPRFEELSSSLEDANIHYTAKVIYHPTKTNYRRLVGTFLRSIDPTDSTGQFMEKGMQFAPVIWVQSLEEQRIAMELIESLKQSRRFAFAIKVECRPYLQFKAASYADQHRSVRFKIQFERLLEESKRQQFLRKAWVHQRLESTLKEQLTTIQFQVTQKNATEAPFRNAYYNHFEPGIYVDIVSGEPLFSSKDQFDSGCGWPSFSKELNKIITQVDRSYGLRRVEVRSLEGNSHLGHLFDDGPKESGGLRYCINSAALRFISKDDLVKEGYSEYYSMFHEE